MQFFGKQSRLRQIVRRPNATALTFFARRHPEPMAWASRTVGKSRPEDWEERAEAGVKIKRQEQQMASYAESRPTYAELEDFLLASIGEDAAGQSLTILSVLSRLDLDPEQESRRVSSLPAEAATVTVAAWIDAMPDGSWRQTDARLIAVRILAYLPFRPLQAESLSGGGANDSRTRSLAMRWLTCAALGGLVLYAIWCMQGGTSELFDFGAL